MNTQKVFLLILSLSFVCFFDSQAQEKSNKMVPTSSSENAVQLYYKSIEAAENADFSESVNFMNEALNEDPDFFMVHCQRALYAMMSGNYEQLKKHADKALASPHELNEAELLLKSALVRIRQNPEADLRDTGKKIVKLHPKDKNSYYTLAVFQAQQEDFKGAAGTYRKGMKVTDNPAPFYNMLGYTYMQDGDMKKAEESFDKYIELHPNHPNPYDSKGDYYMQKKEYDKAYDSFMKAYKINSNWSFEKAQKAKDLMNETEGS